MHHILLVDDNAGDAFLIALILSEAALPLKVHVARDGVQALFKLAEQHPALVILDLDLPILSGHDVLRQYHPADVPIVVFSSTQSAAEQQLARDEGAREFVQKPVHFEEYRRAVLALVEKWIPATGASKS